MKKMEYIAPEQEVVELKLENALLADSDPNIVPGTGESEEL